MTTKSATAFSTWAAFACAGLFFLFEFVARISPSLAPEEIARWFGLSEGVFSTLASLFFWIYAPMQIVVGLLLDRFGARRFVLPAILACAAGMALFAATDMPLVAAAARLLTGLGASFAFVGALYIVNHRFAPGRFALLSGLVNAVGMLGTAIGATALSLMVEAQGWRPVFLAIALAGLGIFGLALAFLRDGPDAPRPAADPHPLAPLRPLLRDGRVWLIALQGALFYMPVNVYGGLWGKAELMADRGFGDGEAEFTVSMIFWGMALGSVGAGLLSDLLGHRQRVLLLGTLLAGVSYAVALFAPGLPVAGVAVALLLAGTFNGAQMLTFAMAKEGHPAAISGTLIAFVNMVGIGGALVFQPLVGALLDATGGYFVAMLTIPGAVLLSAALAVFIRESRHPDHAA
ncbi:MAG: MFS transporter [Rhodobacter sp.]|nr:MFS transporter [Paracoccaceae bacterium]MCC0077204.1 MFS transporter [Rhodobacter sp.]